MPDVVGQQAQAVARLRPKNQLTLPHSALRLVGAEVGDRFLVSTDGEVIRLEPVRASYAGALKDVWPADWQDELRSDRDGWQP